MKPGILGIGTALPDTRMSQMDICDGMDGAFNSRRAPALFRATQVESRYLVKGGLDWYRINHSSGERLAAYIETAPQLSAHAAKRALAQANLSAQEIDALIVTSSTGVDCPGVDVKIAEFLDMSPYLRRTTIVGMGCQALLPSLRNAANDVRARQNAKVLVITVELCSLHFQHTSNIRNILGSALFSDGASAAVVGHSNDGPFLLDSLTHSDYQTQDEMVFHPGDTGYSSSISGKIPRLLGEALPHLVDKLLNDNGLRLGDISHWVVHPGGMAILDAVEESLDLAEGELNIARYILCNFGNMSSATLLFVLERVIQEAKPQPGESGLVFGFGPGITVEIGLIQW